MRMRLQIIKLARARTISVSYKMACIEKQCTLFPCFHIPCACLFSKRKRENFIFVREKYATTYTSIYVVLCAHGVVYLIDIFLIISQFDVL